MGQKCPHTFGHVVHFPLESIQINNYYYHDILSCRVLIHLLLFCVAIFYFNVIFFFLTSCVSQNAFRHPLNIDELIAFTCGLYVLLKSKSGQSRNTAVSLEVCQCVGCILSGNIGKPLTLCHRRLNIHANVERVILHFYKKNKPDFPAGVSPSFLL